VTVFRGAELSHHLPFEKAKKYHVEASGATWHAISTVFFEDFSGAFGDSGANRGDFSEINVNVGVRKRCRKTPDTPINRP
jgi:hypothetical protein